jgi:hypothetical protein
MNATDVKIRPEQADELIALYCDWREESVIVEAAYQRFDDASPPDRALAFAAYEASLDREESAAARYEAQIVLITCAATAERVFTAPRQPSEG